MSHAVVLKPLISGQHNFVPAHIIYKTPAGGELVSWGRLLGRTGKLGTPARENWSVGDTR